MGGWSLLLFAITLVALTVVAVGAHECTLQVSPGTSIQEVIDAAPAGAVVCLSEGTWKENLVIAKPITIKGQGTRTVILGEDYQPYSPAPVAIVMIKGDASIKVVLENLLILAGPEEAIYPKHHGIMILGRSQVVARKVEIANGDVGVFVGDTARLTLSESIILGNRYGVLVTNTAWVQISDTIVSKSLLHNLGVYGDAQAILSRSSIVAAHGYGIEVTGRAELVVDLCEIRGGSAGVVLMDNARARITSSSIQEAKTDGIMALNNSQVHVLKTRLSRNVMAGIVGKDNSKIELIECVVRDNEVGIGIRYASSARLISNLVEHNSLYGVSLVNLVCFPCNIYLKLYAQMGQEIAFRGEVSGAQNLIRNNGRADVCPQELLFLGTSEGGSRSFRD